MPVASSLIERFTRNGVTLNPPSLINRVEHIQPTKTDLQQNPVILNKLYFNPSSLITRVEYIPKK